MLVIFVSRVSNIKKKNFQKEDLDVAFLKPLHHLFCMHIKHRLKGSSQQPVGCARLIIKPQTSALADEIKTALVTLRPANGTVRTEQFILAC